MNFSYYNALGAGKGWVRYHEHPVLFCVLLAAFVSIVARNIWMQYHR